MQSRRGLVSSWRTPIEQGLPSTSTTACASASDPASAVSWGYNPYIGEYWALVATSAAYACLRRARCAVLADVKVDRSLRGGLLWQGEAEAHEVTRQLVE